jgi:hypothetical protein
MKRPFAIAAVVIAAGAAWLWWRQAQTVEPAAPATAARVQLPLAVPPLQPVQRDQATAPAAPPPEPPAIAVPGMLDGSDDMARAAAGELSPLLLKWLLPTEQIRKWVALVDQIADGRLPDKNRPLLFPMPVFDTVTVDDSLRMNPTNFTRANLLIDTLTAIDDQKLADYYHAWRPLLESAYRELGKSDDFHARLLLALQNIVEAPPPPADAVLVRPKVFYVYADPALEKNSAVTRLLWRLGPDNARRLQAYLGGLMSLL